MASYSFSAQERYAVYSVHGQSCYLCGKPVDLHSMQVDHVIPGKLICDQEEFSRVRIELGLPGEFDLNSFENWLPSCGPCNRTKSDNVFEPVPIVLVWLKRASEKAALARAYCTKSSSDREIAKAVNAILRSSSEELSPEIIEPLALHILEMFPEKAREWQEAVATGVMYSGFPPVLLRLPITPTMDAVVFLNGVIICPTGTLSMIGLRLIPFAQVHTTN